MIDLFTEVLYLKYLSKKEGVKSCNNNYDWETITDLYNLNIQNNNLKKCNLPPICEDLNELINTL